jgi:hypothetical protein
VLIGLLVCLCAAIFVVVARLHDWRSIDLRNYLAAAQMILRGESPYKRVEFFAPPWMAVLVGPLLALPENLAGLLWTVLSIATVGGAAAVAIHWLGVPASPSGRAAVVVLAAVTPAALFVYVTGQVSALVALAAVWLADLLRRGRLRAGWLLLAVLVASLKPHIVGLLVLMCLFELVRRRAWKALAWIALGMAGVALVALAVIPSWPSDLLAAWWGGAFRGGRPGLVSPGYFGLAELGLGPWFFAPLALYALYRWWKGGLGPTTVSLALAVGLLLSPYSRGYDDVVLILPALVLILAPALRRRALGAAAGAAGLLLPVTNLSLLAPVAVVLGLLVQAEAPRKPGSAE